MKDSYDAINYYSFILIVNKLPVFKPPIKYESMPKIQIKVKAEYRATFRIKNVTNQGIINLEIQAPDGANKLISKFTN